MSLRTPACSLKARLENPLFRSNQYLNKVVFNIGISLTVLFTAFETVVGVGGGGYIVLGVSLFTT